jgi:hypothetical protein
VKTKRSNSPLFRAFLLLPVLRRTGLPNGRSVSWLFLLLALGSFIGAASAPRVHGALAYEQPHNGTGTVYHSCWLPPDGTVYDEYLWDNFTLSSSQAITEIRWRGGHDPAGAAYTGPVSSFRIRIYPSIAGGSEPDVTATPLCNYTSSGNCGETLAGTFGSTTLYDYHFTMPSAFQAAANVKYWVQITANQASGIPDWGFAAGSGGNGSHFRKLEYQYQAISGDAAFSLHTSDAPSATISASVETPGTGTVLGAGVYPIGGNATVTATPAAGYGFSSWTVSGTVVSTAAQYTFAVTANRTLVAHFVPSCVITTDRYPVMGGHVSASGTYNTGAQVTVSATAGLGYVFAGWLDGGGPPPVSGSSSYTFTASGDRLLIAQFDPKPGAATFDFDTGTPPCAPTQGMPSTQTNSGLTATFTALTGYWSVQNTIYYWKPRDFDGNFLYPSSAGSSLEITFDHPITEVRLDFATAELAADYDTASFVRIKAYQGSTSNPLIGSGTARGAWITGSYPEGAVSFSSATPFDVITVDIPPGQGYPVSGLLFVDNLVAVQAMAAVALQASPLEGGTVSGAGSYPVGTADVVLSAVPNPGYIFQNWTENGVQVSDQANFLYSATANTTLVAHFTPGYTITTSVSSGTGGAISGGGAYPSGTSVTLTATAETGYNFVNWTENGLEVSTDAAYTFIAGADRDVVANFSLIIPQLAIGTSTPGTLHLRWPAALPGWVLEESPDLRAGSWMTSLETVTVNGDQNEVLITPLTGSRFFRLTHP